MSLDPETLREQFLERLRAEVRCIEPMRGGANSRVAKVTTVEGRAFLAKMYIQPEGDNRDRLGTEFGGLRFLWDHGVRCVPEPVFSDRNRNLAVYGFVPGRLLDPKEIDSEHLRQSAEFLVSLKTLTMAAGADEIGEASDACFSIQAHFCHIEARLQRIRLVDHAQLAWFLTSSLLPAWERIKRSVLQAASEKRVDLDHPLSLAERTLSPSDVGFHNILYDGERDRLVFLDFEYFGWDDPAKMMCDFILQPARPMPGHLAPVFVREMFHRFPFREKLAQRLLLAFLPVGIKWCLIILNPFLPERQGLFGPKRDAVLNRQLRLCREMLSSVYDYFQTQKFARWAV